ncbi:MRG/MORF4L-binding protein [Clonorchis sinensis]|uniref:MRG/MORF4L-binding protein n=2 Tax=Clonorchis sinensis TaxID=79923 RepID=A0A8T1MDK6_CLOSI|nr:MRG/MORF4L-binding protein [Clonorchis sinensis]GAA35874.2 MRG-binding protein [Clonorchis sinensis]
MGHSIDWSPQMEIELFRAIMKYKPVGADRHFQMIYIKSILNSRLHSSSLTTDDVWQKLESLYNMDELHESEVNPFQSKMREFSLPDEFSTLKAQPFPRVKSYFGDTATGSSDSDAPHPKRLRKSLRSTDDAAGLKVGDEVKVDDSAETPTRKNRRRN